jgi:hypothetical protein
MLGSISQGLRTNYSLLSKLSYGIRPNADLSKNGADLTRGPNFNPKIPAAPWSNTFPAPQATLDLDFVNDRGFVRGSGQGRSMDAVTFTRASNGTFVGSDGKLKTVGFVKPLTTYQKTTSSGIPENVLSHSENFSNVYWNKVGCSIISDSQTAPDQTISADSLIEQSGSLSAVQITVSNGGNATGNNYRRLSIYVKIIPGSATRYVYLGGRINSGTRWVYGLFDPADGTFVRSLVDGVQSSFLSFYSESVGDGWYRIGIAFQHALDELYITYGITDTMSPSNSSADLSSYVGDGTSGIYIWGAQEIRVLDGFIYQPRFDWASTTVSPVKNLLLNSNLSTNRIFSNSTVTDNTLETTAPDGTYSAMLVRRNIGNTNMANFIDGYSYGGNLNQTLSISFYAKPTSINPASYLGFSWMLNIIGKLNPTNGAVVGTPLANNGTLTSEDAGNGWRRYKFTGIKSNQFRWFEIGLDGFTSQGVQYNEAAQNYDSGIYLWGYQLEISDSVSEYTVTGNHIPQTKTLGVSATCNGLLIEESRANRLLWCRDATQTQWTKTNVTAAKGQTGIDGVVNSASSLTATANGGACIQTITLASGSRTGSVYLKRITGTGIVQVTLDGTTYSTVDLSSTEWRRVVLSGTVTNPTVGILLATSGDAVAMDYGQIEDGADATSPILTTAASVTRSLDNATIEKSNFDGFYNQTKGTFYLSHYPSTVPATRYALSVQRNGNAAELITISCGVNTVSASCRDGGATTIATSSFTTYPNYLSKTAMSYSPNSVCIATQSSFNNVLLSSVVANRNIPANITRLGISRYFDNSNIFNQTIGRLVYIPDGKNIELIKDMVTAT